MLTLGLFLTFIGLVIGVSRWLRAPTDVVRATEVAHVVAALSRVGRHRLTSRRVDMVTAMGRNWSALVAVLCGAALLACSDDPESAPPVSVVTSSSGLVATDPTDATSVALSPPSVTSSSPGSSATDGGPLPANIGICEQELSIDGKTRSVVITRYATETGEVIDTTTFVGPNFGEDQSASCVRARVNANVVNDDLTAFAVIRPLDDDVLPGTVDREGAFTAAAFVADDSDFAGGADLRAEEVAIQPGSGTVWWITDTLLFNAQDTTFTGSERAGCAPRTFGIQFTSTGEAGVGSVGCPAGSTVLSDAMTTRNGLMVTPGDGSGIVIPETSRDIEKALEQPANESLVFLTKGPDAADPNILWVSPTGGEIVPEELVVFPGDRGRQTFLLWNRASG